jgi:hypothetical protein
MTGVEQQSVGADKFVSVQNSKTRQGVSGDSSFVTFMSAQDGRASKRAATPAFDAASGPEKSDPKPVQALPAQIEDPKTLSSPPQGLIEATHVLTNPVWSLLQLQQSKDADALWQDQATDHATQTVAPEVAIGLPQHSIAQNDTTAWPLGTAFDGPPHTATTASQAIATDFELHQHDPALGTDKHGAERDRPVTGNETLPTNAAASLSPMTKLQKQGDTTGASAPFVPDQPSSRSHAAPRPPVMQAYAPGPRATQATSVSTFSATPPSHSPTSGVPIVDDSRQFIGSQPAQLGLIDASTMQEIIVDASVGPTSLNDKTHVPSATLSQTEKVLQTGQLTRYTTAPSNFIGNTDSLRSSSQPDAQPSPKELPTSLSAPNSAGQPNTPTMLLLQTSSAPPATDIVASAALAQGAPDNKPAQVAYSSKLAYLSAPQNAELIIETMPTSENRTKRGLTPELTPLSQPIINAPQSEKSVAVAVSAPPQDPALHAKTDMPRQDMIPVTNAPISPVASTPAPQFPQPITYQNHPSLTVPALTHLVTERAQSGKPSAVELTLTPDELGKIRLILTPDGDKVRVVLHAERPETMDLMRRNTDAFVADLRTAGFNNPSFSFANWGDAPKGGSRQKHNASNHSANAVFSAAPVSSTHRAEISRAGLDLRV